MHDGKSQENGPQHMGELDEEFITATNEDYESKVNSAMLEVAQAQVEEKKKRTRTYLSSELPVRPCTGDCPHRTTCKDFVKGRVKDLEPCRPELRNIKKWQRAFRSGNLDELKDEAGAVAGSMAVQIGRLLEAVVRDGVVVESTRYTNSGIPYIEKTAHPALATATKMAKDLGIDLSQYLMTPKAAKDNGTQVQVNIGISAEEVQARFSARFSKKDDSS
ncbi:hypothetical protein [Brevibacillus laterosporus]|uniref:hypothetical protein n=1 Tax=Brevibacillus laterosporus TaxID=1465 RepID=UPI00264EEED2|nr:hypothetical protein [Brevibacillus laterosporus]MDN9011101.1 hypothetical protein [Brevibacillus laterosporus]MDO0942124.1 hypothetical protein [Brevibacillus laterosporus]